MGAIERDQQLTLGTLPSHHNVFNDLFRHKKKVLKTNKKLFLLSSNTYLDVINHHLCLNVFPVNEPSEE